MDTTCVWIGHVTRQENKNTKFKNKNKYKQIQVNKETYNYINYTDINTNENEKGIENMEEAWIRTSGDSGLREEKGERQSFRACT